jgi:hypothetical protein
MMAAGLLLTHTGAAAGQEIDFAGVPDEVVEVAGVTDINECLGGRLGLRVDGPAVVERGGSLRASDGDFTVHVMASEGTLALRFFDFLASDGVNAVIVDGGETTLRFAFDPHAVGATELHAGADQTGMPRTIDSILFCHD